VIAAVSAQAFAIVSELAPSGVEVRELPDGLDDAAFILPEWPDRDTLEALPRLERLRVVQSLAAGTDWIEDLIPPWATLCSARGARDAPVAEWVVGALLGDAYGQLEVARSRRWEYHAPVELLGSTVLIIGFGSIGRALERRLEPFGVTVIRVALRAREGVHAASELPDLVGAADAVVVLAPLTPATTGLIDAALLARMRDGALLVNAGRGRVVDTDALVAELRSGRLRAVLDVADPRAAPRGPSALGPRARDHAAQCGRQRRRRRAGDPLRSRATRALQTWRAARKRGGRARKLSRVPGGRLVSMV
jgi:phosphoglycerate dehydrogenase-like enzyme